eukprot:13055114-Alexandrium_andersonii.AAC.1
MGPGGCGSRPEKREKLLQAPLADTPLLVPPSQLALQGVAPSESGGGGSTTAPGAPAVVAAAAAVVAVCQPKAQTSTSADFQRWALR